MNDPKPISEHLDSVTAEIERRLSLAVDAHKPVQAAMAAAAAAKAPSALEERGYPLRAILTLPRMEGPGLQWARKLLPMALGDGLIVLAGGPGTGKTVIATWLAWQREETGLPVGRFYTAYELFARMKQCWGKNEDSEAVLSAWKKAPFLVIDEAQTRAGDVWDNNVLDELINARYARMLPTVLIANVTLAEAQKSLGPRIMDRANEAGGIVECTWPSYRS